MTSSSYPPTAEPGSSNYVGVNLGGISYYSTEQPFLNIFKQAGSNSIVNGWFTSNSKSLDTDEEACINVDSDGYPTSLSKVNTAGCASAQSFTFLQTFINYTPGTQSSLPPGAAYPYSPGEYTLRFRGEGKISLGFDVRPGSLSTSTPNCKVSGLIITSSMAVDKTCTVRFDIPAPKAGIAFAIIALPSSSNYIRAVSIVQSAQEADYEAGELFNPRFKAELTNAGAGGYKQLRFMWWLNTVTQEMKVDFTTALQWGATAGTMSSVAWYNGSSATWPLATGTYAFVFANGQTIEVNCIHGSSSITWHTPLSAPIKAKATGSMAVWVRQGSWSQRSLLSNAFWSGMNGVPYEAIVQLCNELNADCWINLPLGSGYVTNSGYTTDLAKLIYSGDGANIAGSNLKRFSGLNPHLKWFEEASNEVWNLGSAYGGAAIALMMAANVYPAWASGNVYYSSQEWYGMQEALAADAIYSVYGDANFAQRVVPVMAGQFDKGNGVAFMEQAMNTPDWKSRAYTHHIGAVAFSPYFGTTEISSSDAVKILRTVNALDTLFALSYSNMYGGVLYDSIPAAGFVGNTLALESAIVGSFSKQPWRNIAFVGYEGGSGMNTNGTAASGVKGWLSLITKAHRDSRFAYLYYDPTHQLSSNPGFLPQSKSNGFLYINTYQDISDISQYGEWGALEHVMQTIHPLAAAPSKYRGIMSYVDQ